MTLPVLSGWQNLTAAGAVTLRCWWARPAGQAPRAAVLVPWAVPTIVAAQMWGWIYHDQFGLLNDLLLRLGLIGQPLAWTADPDLTMAAVVLADVWKTTPFMALLLMAGLTLVPEDLLRAARVDGASALQRLFRITLPVMKPAILVALLFRTLDAFRIFDTVFVQTRGAQSTESVSIVGYHTLITRLNLGLGSAVSVLIFACVVIIALLFLKGFGTALARGEGER